MKTNKKIVAGLAVTAIIALSFGSAYAMGGNGYGNGDGQGRGKGMHQGNGQGKSMYREEGKRKQGIKQSHNPAEMLKDIEKQDVNAVEIDLLKKQYEEEMMANELYTSFYEKYGIETFKKISDSEAKHMEAVKALLDRYDIEVPANYDHIQDLYNSLKEAGSKSAFDALEVGVKIEFVDIDDIVKAIKATDNDDIKIVFTNIGGGSYNHLRGFFKAIDNNGYKTDLDWSKYLEKSDLSVKGPIKYKLAEKLEADGVELPEQVSSSTIKNKGKYRHGEEGNGNMKKHMQNLDQGVKKYINQIKIEKYKKRIEKQYNSRLDSFSKDKLEKINIKIDDLTKKIVDSNSYSNIKKQSYVNILLALKSSIIDRLEDNQINIDELLK